MTDQSPTPVALPQTHILTYLSSINTPTRIRKVAASAVATLGILQTLVGYVGTIGIVTTLWTDTGVADNNAEIAISN